MSKRGKIVGREAFMLNIAARLGRQAPLDKAPRRETAGVPEDYAAETWTTAENVDRFVQNWTQLGGQARVIREAEAAAGIAAFLQEAVKEHQVERALMWDHDRLNALGLDEALGPDVHVLTWRSDAGDLEPFLAVSQAPEGGNWAGKSALLRAAETCDLGIVWADFAIANTGTLALLARGGQGRSVSLLPNILFAVVHEDDLFTRMGQMFAAVQARYPEVAAWPSSLNLVTGPSRSSDIENDLTIGVHGPGIVYAAVITKS